MCVASKQLATTQLEQQTGAEQPSSLNNTLSVLPALGSHAFVPDSVAVHFRVHSVLVGPLLQRSSLVMLVLLGLGLLARHTLLAGEGNTFLAVLVSIGAKVPAWLLCAAVAGALVCVLSLLALTSANQRQGG